MQGQAEFQEIENLGIEEEPGPQEAPPAKEKGGSILPYLQLFLCVLALLALVFLKLTDKETYNRVTDWYRDEASNVIELPGLASDAPAAETDVGVLQRV